MLQHFFSLVPRSSISAVVPDVPFGGFQHFLLSFFGVAKSLSDDSSWETRFGPGAVVGGGYARAVGVRDGGCAAGPHATLTLTR